MEDFDMPIMLSWSAGWAFDLVSLRADQVFAVTAGCFIAKSENIP
jgi:hypothetical protein